jgi:hypothetical protein
MQNRNKYASLRFPLFSLYTEELNFWQTIWDKTQVLLRTSWGTHLEHFENKGKKQKIPVTPPPQKENNWATVNQHPPVRHPLDACYDSVVDDPQLSYYPILSW